MTDDKDKWVTIAQVEANNKDNDDSSSDSDGFTDFISFLSTPVGTSPPPPSPTKSSITNTKLENVEGTANSSSDETAPNNSNNNNPKPQLLSLPSYYVDSFHEHFFPHADDEDNDELVVRKKLSIPQRYVYSLYDVTFANGDIFTANGILLAISISSILLAQVCNVNGTKTKDTFINSIRYCRHFIISWITIW